MPSASDRSPSTISSCSPGRRILSRITSPFSSKTRSINDFSIEPAHPHKQYSPGDVATGCVRLRVTRPIRVTHIVVCLHGFVQVYRNPGSPEESQRNSNTNLGTGRGKRDGEYFGNGFATLFEDEVVLCGDGRLAEGAYQFNYELEFPDRDLPSSIDFERGTITYMITATMTRPVTISPTMTCDHKVYFVERIDISPLYPPKPRTITLEPLAKRSRPKTQARRLVDASDKQSQSTDSAQQSSGDTPRPSEVSSAPSNHGNGHPPGSPSQSDMSLDSSQEYASQPELQIRESPTASEAGRLSSSKISIASKVITVTIESQAGGCLRGDSIPVKVNVSHVKHMRSMTGVIVTLYRHARVDMRPALPIGPTEKGKGPKYEDYYPKSVTGLGGLSLSGAGASHIFRKDLSQAMAPLVINPQTLAAEVSTKIRVPEEAFPTISTVPGAMISFKYYVEVVVDIVGKLAGQDRALTNLAGQVPPAGHELIFDGSNMERSAFTPFGSTILDTAPIRRDKSVVACSFEVIIGTRDSERKKGKQKIEVEPEPETEQIHNPVQQPVAEPYHSANGGTQWDESNGYYDRRRYEDAYAYDHPPDQNYFGYGDYHYDQPPPPVPVPDMPDEAALSEKERMRLAEERLLPSQPPDMERVEGQAVIGATAPYLPEEGGHEPIPEQWPEVPEYEPRPSGSNTQPPLLIAEGMDGVQQPDVAPQYDHPPASSSAPVTASTGDDKQEMHRQQLQAEASAPPTEENNDTSQLPTAPTHEPVAPTIDEAEALPLDVHDSHADAAGSGDLPRYER